MADRVTRGPETIALDGPAAAGKTTVGRRLASALDMLCFDTGLLYRALTVAALRADLSPEDETALVVLMKARPIDVLPASEGRARIEVGGEDVTSALRDPAVDAKVSAVSQHAGVRDALLEAQRRIARQGPVVMLGRDIGTVVLPEADLKIYLDASVAARARRRFRERLAKGEPAAFADVYARMEARDARDRGRAVAPLRPAENAVIVDSDRCDIDAVVAHLVGLAERWPDELTTQGGDAPCVPV